MADGDDPRIVYGVGTKKPGQGHHHHHHHGSHHRTDPTAHRRQYHSHHHHHSRHMRHRIAVTVLSILIALVVVVGVGAFLLIRSALGVSRSAQQLTGQLTTVEQALATGDSSTFSTTADDIASAASSMHEETSNPLWKVSSHLPIVGRDLYNVRALARALDELSQSVLMPLSQQADSLDLAHVFRDGRVDVPTIKTLGDIFATAAPQVQATTDMLNNYTEEGRFDAVNNVLSRTKDSVDQINAVVQSIGTLGPYAPQILGGEGETRHYIVVAMGNSEIRSAGGFAGDYGLLTITDGQIEMGQLDGLHDTSYNGIANTPDELNYLGLARRQMAPDGVPGDATFNPNYPRTCEFIIANWNKVYHPDYTIDGVIAADPQFVQDMLAVVGSITTSDGDTVDGTNAAKYMLSDVYWKWEQNSDQNRVFSEIANLTFDKMMHNTSVTNLLQIAQVAQEDIRNRDLNIWFADDDAQLTLVGMGLANIIDDGTTGASLLNPLLGLYFYDVTYAKIEWYLNAQTYIGNMVQNSDGTKTYTVTTTLKNELTQEEVQRAPRYVLGSRFRGTDQDGTMTILVDFVAPAGGKIEVQSSTFELEETTFMNRDVWRNLADIAPQETETITYTVTVPAEAVSDLTLNMTPTCQKAAGWK